MSNAHLILTVVVLVYLRAIIHLACMSWVARLAGRELSAVTFGVGRPLWSLKWRGLDWKWAIPIPGSRLEFREPATGKWAVMHPFLFYAAAELLGLLLACILLSPSRLAVEVAAAPRQFLKGAWETSHAQTLIADWARSLQQGLPVFVGVFIAKVEGLQFPMSLAFSATWATFLFAAKRLQEQYDRHDSLGTSPDASIAVAFFRLIVFPVGKLLVPGILLLGLIAVRWGGGLRWLWALATYARL